MYKTGDIVKIRSDIKEGNYIDPELYITREMTSFAGAITKIMGRVVSKSGGSSWKLMVEITGGAQRC